MKNLLLAAAIGDISGVPYEFKGRTKDYDAIDLLNPKNKYSDDTICTFACAEALIEGKDMAECLHRRGREDFYRGFGGRFAKWLMSPEIKPSYGSFGNGSGMRASSAGFLAKTKEECIELATQTALPTHDHPEGIKGAQATALCIYLARKGEPVKDIRNRISKEFGYELSLSVEEIRPRYSWQGLDGKGNGGICQDSVPQAIICALEARDFEDAIRNAVSIGGDSDTIGCITGGIAEGLFGIPEAIREEGMTYLPKELRLIVEEFETKYGCR